MLMLFVPLLAGCGLTGNRSRFQVELGAVPSDVEPLRVDTVALEEGMSRLKNVGTFAWGKYDRQDIKVLRESLVASARPLAPAAGQPAHSIHVMIRRFLVAHSNNEALALACVSWALSNSNQEIELVEQFYAADHVVMWGTVGGIKDTVHQALSERILKTAILALSGRSATRQPVEHTYNTYEEATAELPNDLPSVHAGLLMLGNGYWVYRATYKGGSDIAWTEAGDHFDWPSFFSRQLRLPSG
ncbi:MAG: hypothetical protein AAGA56_27415 [Myxococcota bacterium]